MQKQNMGAKQNQVHQIQLLEYEQFVNQNKITKKLKNVLIILFDKCFGFDLGQNKEEKKVIF